MTTPALHDLTLTRPGETSPVTLTTNGIAASWAVRPPGTLSAEVVTADLIDAFGTTDLAHAYWVFWEHPTAGRWGGVVTATEATKASGTTEVAARDMTELVAARATAKVYDLPAIGAGGAVEKLIFDAGRASPTWIAGVELDALLPAIPFQSRGDQVLAAIDRLIAEADAEYQVTPDRILRVARRLGRDLSATVQLMEDQQITDFRFPQTGDALRNELTAVAADDAFARTTAVVVADDASIQRRGLRQETVVFEGMTTETQLKPAALAALARRVKLGRSLTLTLIEDDPDDPTFAAFRERDTVGVLLPSVNWAGDVRVLVRAVDTTTNLMTITGEVVRDAA